jgi:hypothetical protein
MRLRKTGKGKRQLSFLAAAFLLTLMTGGLSGPAYAACTNPPGVTGQQMYNVSEHIMQYCNAAGDWIAMSGTTTAGGSGGTAFEIPPPTPCTITSGQMSVLSSTATSAGANTVVVHGNTAYVGSDSNSNRLRSINISNPAAMVSLQNLNLGFGANDISISADGTKIFTEGSSTDTFAVVNVSNPSSMSVTGTYNSGNIADNGAAIIRHPTNPNYVYVSSVTDKSVDVANVTNPASISRAGGYTHATNTANPHGMAISGNTLFVVSDSNDRITALNISTPGTPTLAGTMTSASLDGAWDVAVSGNYAFVLSKSSSKFASVDISNPASMTVVDTITDANISTPWYVTIAGNYAFIGSRSNNKIVAVDISDPANLTVVDSLTVSGAGFETHMTVKDDVLYVPGYSSNLLYAIDLGCAPGGTTFELGDIVTPTCPAGYTYNKALAGCYEAHTTYANWTTAQGICAGSGGYLIKPDSEAEEAFASAAFGGSVQTWAGLTDAAVEGTWVWSNGEPYARTNWASGEPNNASNEDCVEIPTTLKWNDVPCTNTRPYVCEAPATFADATCPPGYKFHPKAMKCFKYVATSAAWNTAEAACEADGGNLPIIMDAKKQAVVDTIAGNPLDVSIGYSDAAVEGKWVWVNGVLNGANDYSNWEASEPNASGDYAYTGYTNGTWDDSTGNFNYICERDADEICMPENHNVVKFPAATGTTATLTNYTVPDVTDGTLIVVVGNEAGTVAPATVTSVTFGGQPLTLATQTSVNDGSGSSNNVAIYYLTGPAASTGNIVVNFSGAATEIGGYATVVNCLAQEGPEAVATNTFPQSSLGAHTITSPVTTLTDLAFIVDGTVGNQNTTATTLENDQIEIASTYYNAGGGSVVGMSSRFVDYAGTYNMSWNFSNVNRIPHVMAAFRTNLFGNNGDNMGNEIATQSLDMQSYKITNAATPTDPNDGATKAYVDSKTGANETDPQVGTVNTSGNYCLANGSKIDCTINPSGAAAPPPLMAIFAEQQPSGTDATAAVTGSWQTHVLNTMLGNTIGASLNTNEVTLPAGTYYIDAVIPFKKMDFATARLVDSSDTLLIQGSSVFCSSAAGEGVFTCHSYIRGVITLAMSEDIKIQYYVQSAASAQTLGDATAQGTEQYATLTIQKLD